MAPWFLFLFVAVVDIGFFCNDVIAVENAARVAAEYTSGSSTTAADATGACTLVLADMASIPNVRNLTTCGSSPLTVTAASITGPDSKPATSVSVTYTSNALFPIPGLLKGTLSITRNVQMRIQ